MTDTIEHKIENDNLLRMFYDLDEKMMQAKADEDVELALSTARELLEHPELPLLIRARACMVIGCSDEEDFLEMAKEAVRIAELGMAQTDDPGPLTRQLVEDTRSVLKDATEAWEEARKEKEGDKGDEEGKKA